LCVFVCECEVCFYAVFVRTRDTRKHIDAVMQAKMQTDKGPSARTTSMSAASETCQQLVNNLSS
jgi:hypothetical protein